MQLIIKLIMNNSYEKLKIFTYRQTILQHIQKHNVVIIHGETGCGKTTQIPKFIYQNSLQNHLYVNIIITQPRRIVTKAIAKRVAKQLNTQLGNLVGYQIGFKSEKSNKTRILYVTTGVFIQRLTHQQGFLDKFTHIIFDQIHERSLDCDFTLISIKQLLNLMVLNKFNPTLILMSATINSQLYSNYFAKNAKGQFNNINSYNPNYKIKKQGRQRQNQSKQQPYLILNSDMIPAKVLYIDVQRQFQVEVVYEEQLNQNQQKFQKKKQYNVIPQSIIYSMMAKACRIIQEVHSQGNILVFLPGFLQIAKLKQEIQNLKLEIKIIMLHSSLESISQHQLFEQTQQSKVILSTNIAQTSITLPNIKFVIDFCLVKTYSFNPETSFQTLKLQWANKSSLQQRKGRTGRTCNGKCFRLITEKMYNKLNDFQIAQIKRHPLQKLILRIKKIDLGTQNNKIRLFNNPYQFLMNAIEPPQKKHITQGINLLLTFKALEYMNGKRDANNLKITDEGIILCELPCNVKLGKSILLSYKLGCYVQIIEIAAILQGRKKFFKNQFNRADASKFYDMLIMQDGQQWNDVRIKQKIFKDWRQRFFLLGEKKKYIQYKSQWIQEQQQQQKIQQMKIKLNKFIQRSPSNTQKQFCQKKFIYPSNMRQILKRIEEIKYRLSSKNLIPNKFISDEKQHLKPLMIKFALLGGYFCKGFEIQSLQRYLPQQDSLNMQKTVAFNLFKSNKKQMENKIKQFLSKFKQPIQNIVQHSNMLFFQLTNQGNLKLRMPQKSNNLKLKQMKNKARQFFQWFMQNKAYYNWKFQYKDLQQIKSNYDEDILVDNQSINSKKIKNEINNHQGFIIALQIFSAKRYIILKQTFHLNFNQYIIGIMLFSSSVQFVPDSISLYLKYFVFQNNTVLLPFYLTEQLWSKVLQFRMLIGKLKFKNESLFKALSSVLGTKTFQIQQSQQWQVYFLRQEKRFKYDLTKQYIDKQRKAQQSQNIFNLKRNIMKQQQELTTDQIIPQTLPSTILNNQKQVESYLDYKKRYREWKKNYYFRIKNFKAKTKIKQPTLICSECFSKGLIQDIVPLQKLQDQQLEFDYWDTNLIPKNELFFCLQMHPLFKTQNKIDQAQLKERIIKIKIIDMKRIIVYFPNQNTTYLEQVFKLKDEQLVQMNQFKMDQQFNQCIICGLDLIEKQILSHFNSKIHRQNLKKFCVTIK